LGEGWFVRRKKKWKYTFGIFYVGHKNGYYPILNWTKCPASKGENWAFVCASMAIFIDIYKTFEIY
jgi:hypothetical protein